MNTPVLDTARVSLGPVNIADHAWLHASNAIPCIRLSLFDDESWGALARPVFSEKHRSMGNRNVWRHYVRGGEGLGPAT